jgi:hypothetical protein
MPKINSRGDIAHGVGGGQASINNTSYSHGGSGGWIDDHRTLFANGNDNWIVSIYDARTKQIIRAYEGLHLAAPPPVIRPFSRSFRRSPLQIAIGANHAFAGGGHYASWLAGAGLFVSTGFRAPEAGLLGMSYDGAVCYKPQHHSFGPTQVREVSGEEWTLTSSVPSYVHLVGQKRALFSMGFDLFTSNLPAPVYDNTGGLWKAEAAFAAGEWWLSYFCAARGIVLHPFANFEGFSIFPRGDGWHTIREIGADIIRIAVSVGEGEQPGQIWVRDVDVRRGLIRDPWGTTTAWSQIARVDIRTINADQPKPICATVYFRDETGACSICGNPKPKHQLKDRPVPTDNGIVNGVLIDPERYFLSLVHGKRATDYESVIRVIQPALWKYGLGSQNRSSGEPSSRLFLPHAGCRNVAPRPGHTNQIERLPDGRPNPAFGKTEEFLGVRQDTSAAHLSTIDTVWPPGAPTEWRWHNKHGPDYVPLDGTVPDEPDPDEPDPNEPGNSKLAERVKAVENRVDGMNQWVTDIAQDVQKLKDELPGDELSEDRVKELFGEFFRAKMKTLRVEGEVQVAGTRPFRHGHGLTIKVSVDGEEVQRMQIASADDDSGS